MFNLRKLFVRVRNQKKEKITTINFRNMKPELRFSFVFNLFVLCFVVLALPTISFGQQDENQRDKVNVPYPNLTKSTSSAINVQNYTGTNVSNPLHPNKLVTDLLVTGCIQASNVEFRGNREQIGRFDRASDNPNFPLESGIVLSTGKATDAIGPNGSSSRSSEYSLTGEVDLQSLAGVSSSRVSDPSVLTFDFVPNGTVVEFRYIFASDEYPEWACSQYNDVFGFFISGPGLSGSYSNGALNIAKLPDNSPVSINNIHVNGYDQNNYSSPNQNLCPDKNAAYYVSVPSGSTTIEYDGRTTVLTARIEGLQACGTYKMKIALADIYDKKYDSAVFLEAKSLGASGAVIKNFYNLVESDDVFQGCSPNEVRFYREAGSNNTLPQTINYIVEGTAVSGVHHNLTSGTVVIPANQDYVAISYNLPLVALDATKTIIVKADVSCLCSGGSQWVEKVIRIHDPFVLKTFSTTPQTQCNQANGSLTVMAGPGTSSYDYVFTYRLYNSSNQLLSTQSTGANINLTFPNLGSDSYTIRITEEKSCHEIVQSGIIVQSPNAPTLSLSSNSPVCSGETIELNATSSTSGLTYSWSGPSGFNSNIANPVINNAGVANAGTYSLLVTAPNNCTATRGINVAVNALPEVSITANGSLQFCEGGSVILTASAGASYLWSNGSVSQSIEVTEAGNYSVQVTNSNGCSNTAEVAVTVNELPVVEISTSGSTTICEGGSVTLTASEGASYLWSNGAVSQSIEVTEAGNFNVEVTNVNGCSNTAYEAVTVTVNPLPTVSVVEDFAVCYGETISLSAEYANGKLSWDNGVENNVPFAITETTTFTATVTGECGTVSESVTVTVNPLPTVSVVEDFAVCYGETISLSAEYANGELSWDNGIENNVPFAITETTTFTATVTGECGTVSESVTVTVNPLPTVSVVEDFAVCYGETISLSAEYANGELSWDNGIENNVPFAITETTTFTATVTGECGTVSESVTVTINPLPTVSCPETITIGELANPITLGGATPEGGIYEGAGIENGIFNPAIAGVGTHIVTYTAQSEEGCINVCEFEINVISMPNFSCIPSFAVCGNDEAFEIEQPSYAGGTYSGQGVENNIFDPQSVEAGIYDIHYTYVDEFGYVYGCDFTITVNAAPEVNLNAFAPICSGDEAIVLTGGVPEGGIYSGTGVENGIFNPAIAGVGTHEITYTYTDANGCSDNATAQIEVLESLCFDVEVENVSCFGEEDGSIKVIFTCGPPVQVCVDVIGGDKCAPANKTGFAFFGGLAPGTYVIYFTAPNGCVSTQTVVITQPDEIVINIEEVSPLCSNAAPVTLVATPEGGIFTGAGVEGNLFNPALAFTGENVITYTFTDAFGCIGSSDIIITVLEAPVVSIEPIGPFCEDDAIVSMVGTPEGGMFSGNGVSGNTFDPSLAQLGENTITYIYEAENGCIGEASVTISVYPRIEVTLNDFAAVCSNEDAFALTGGYPEGGVYSGVGVVNGMFDPSISGAGIFEITYTYDDPNGCGGYATSTIEVYQTVCVEVTHTDVTCFGEDDGTITVNITCGTAVNICLDVEEGQNCKTVGKTSNVFYGGLAPGNYIVYVTDVNGCLVSVPVTIAEPEELVVQVEGTNPLCNGQEGSAIVTVTGGTGTYSFDWGGADPNALLAGDYQVVVTDGNGCSAIGNVTITEPQELLVNVNVQEMTCSNANDAVVTVTLEGGTPDYEICLVLVGQGTDCLEGQNITEPMVGMTFPGLQPGVYSLNIIDANGCSYEQEITINAIDELIAEVVVNQPACFGETGSAIINVAGGTEPYIIHADGFDLNALTDGTYEVMISDAHDCFTTVSFTIVSPEELVANPEVTNVSCFGGNNGSVVLNVSGGSGEYTYELFGLDLNNLEAGDYMIVVYDANNCSLPVSFAIEEPEMITLSLQADEILCHGETTNITSLVGGGIAPYTYSWNTGSVSSDLENVGGGEYALTVVDANGCQAESSITVIEPEELLLSAEIFHPEAFGEDNGAIETVVTGGTQPYQYLWSNGSTTPSLYGLVAGTYSLSVTDANNCMAFGEYTLIDPELVIDLSVVKTVNYAVADSGRVITFTVVLTNNHPFATAENVVLSDVMDEVFEYKSHSASMGSFNANTFTWNIPSLAAQTSATLSIDVVIHGCGVNSICIVSSSVPDPDMSNNCSTVGACIKESSGGGNGGIESNGNMASKIALRNYRNTVSGNFIEKAARRSQQSKFAMADLLTGELKSASINEQSISGITQFIPEEGPANTEAYVTTPADLIGITNANEIFSVDYLQLDNSRRATILAMVTDPGVVYDHTKVICDRLAGARLEKGSYVNIKGRQFIMSQLVHQNGEVDFAISFVAFRDNNNFVVDNQWINEDYSTSGNDDVFNFQVWSVTPQYTISLVEEILDGMKNAGTLQFVDNNPVMPELYVREGYYRNGTMHLTVVNKSTSRKMTVKGSKADVEDGSRKQFQMQIDLPEGEIIDVEVPVGYVFDAGFTLKGDQSIGRDMLYFADGAWGFDYEEFGAFVNDFNTQAVKEASPEYAYGVERNAQISGRVTTYASLYRSLNTRRVGENLSDYDELVFTANGKGRVEVILAKDGIHNWSEQYRQNIELSSSNETYTLKFNDFVNKSGQKGFRPEDVKTIIFNVLGNGSASSDFEMNVSNVYFGNSLESTSGDGIFIPVYPNPFTRSANIEFGVTRDTQVKVEVLNIYGQVVEVIANGNMTQGYYKLSWTPADHKSGVYLFRVSIGNDTYTSKVVYQK